MQQSLQLVNNIINCTNCRLATDRGGLPVPALPGSKYQQGGLALFLEAPGADEEKPSSFDPRIGEPLVGRSGMIMNQMLLQAGLSRDEVLILNRIRCRPPRNRIADYPDAVAQCDEWVIKELDEYRPKVVVLSGNTALKNVLGANASITNYRGTARATSDAFAYGARIFVPVFHPAYALRQGGIQSQAGQDIIADLRLAKELLNG